MSEIVINRISEGDSSQSHAHAHAHAQARNASSNVTSRSSSPSPFAPSLSSSTSVSTPSRGITASMSDTTIAPADQPLENSRVMSSPSSSPPRGDGDEHSSSSLAHHMPPSASTSTSTSTFLSPIAPQLQSPLLRSPSEIVQKVLANVGGDDVPAVARAAKVCRELRSFIYENIRGNPVFEQSTQDGFIAVPCSRFGAKGKGGSQKRAKKANPDQALWRDIHLQIYDDPRLSGTFPLPRDTSEIDWKRRVQDREMIGRMLLEWDEDRYDEAATHYDLICDTLLDMYLDLPPASPSFDPSVDEEPPNSKLLTAYLRSPLFRHLYLHHSLTEEKPHLRPLPGQTGNPNRRAKRTINNPKISQVHCLLPPEFDEDVQEDRERRGYTREVVYNAANFAKRNDWGPFTDDGKVDWTLVDAISCVMMSNGKDIIRESDDHWRAAVHPMSYGVEPTRGWGYTDLQRPADLPEDELWDWADVKGTWSGSYAFLDYADWVSLNEPRLVLLRRAGSLDLSTYHEAVGDLMKLDLQIVKDPSEHGRCICPRHNVLTDPLPVVTTHLPTSDLLPPIHFAGSSVQHQGPTFPTGTPMSAIRGVVRLTADNPPQVRWTLVIRYGGEDRWRLECVQVGGRGSKRGFFGIWTDALKEEHSPNGPVWYWKD
ncbi:hypothetical protein I317_05770 [Kwoniella heveanensis CBS 569]|nr:hypothetical protein I317_05770 [Kwoniella heveanensis CBS 569]